MLIFVCFITRGCSSGLLSAPGLPHTGRHDELIGHPLRSALAEASYAAARAAYRQQQAEEGGAERGGDVLTRTTTPARATAHVEGMRSASAAARERMQHSAIEMAAAEMGECTFRPSLSTTGGAKGTRGRGRRLVRRGVQGARGSRNLG
jgi:hypothetical protein